MGVSVGSAVGVSVGTPVGVSVGVLEGVAVGARHCALPQIASASCCTIWQPAPVQKSAHSPLETSSTQKPAPQGPSEQTQHCAQAEDAASETIRVSNTAVKTKQPARLESRADRVILGNVTERPKSSMSNRVN